MTTPHTNMIGYSAWALTVIQEVLLHLHPDSGFTPDPEYASVLVEGYESGVPPEKMARYFVEDHGIADMGEGGYRPVD